MKFGKYKRVRGWLKDRHFGGWVHNRSVQISRWLSPSFTANQVTIFGMLLCVPMTIFYLLDAYWPASVLLIVSLLTDFADGALAHYQQSLLPRRPMMLFEERRLTWRQRIDYKGVTNLGKALDPIADKVRFFCVLYALGLGMVSGWLIIALTTVALLLTIIRPIKRWLKLGDASANRLGKLKILAEVVAMGLLVLYPTNLILLNVTFVVAFLLALSSLIGHILGAYITFRARRTKKAGATSKPFPADTSVNTRS